MSQQRLSRRTLIRGAVSLAGGAALSAAAPRFVLGQAAPAAVVPEKMRPQLGQGLQVGDVSNGRAIVWCRADRPSRMMVEYATTEKFDDARRVMGPHAIEASDFTARVDLADLPAGQDMFYRVRFLDLGDLKTWSAPLLGRFRTPPAAKRDITLVWSGDTAGQGWGINKEWGGMKIYETMRRSKPDLFIHSGDTIYADGPIQAEVKLQDGKIWKNVVTPEVSKVAETLKEFRGRYLYNLMDDNVRRFASEVAQVWQWDDHEITNNWSASKDLSADKRYSEKRVGILVGRATRAFLEYAPLRHSPEESERVYRKIAYGPSLDVFVIDMRSYRGPNTHNRQAAMSGETAFLGAEQVAWLKRDLLASRATWKIIAADMPIGLQVGDGKDAEGRARFENLANGDGPALGRELEIAELLRFIKQNRIRNTVWLTADTHYCAAHYYDPAKAQFADFDPFWEFMTGPLNAGTFGPNATDNTFGIEVKYQKHPEGGRVNLPPSEGLQFFGEVKIDGHSEAMAVSLKDVAGATLYKQELAPQRG